MSTTTREDLIYMAGFFDGEGCIRIAKNNFLCRNAVYTLRCIVTNTNKSILEHFQGYFGGGIYSHNWNAKHGYKPCWNWQVNGNEALYFLHQVVSFLKLKSNEAEIAITFQEFKSKHEHRGNNNPWSPMELAMMDEVYLILKTAKTEVLP